MDSSDDNLRERVLKIVADRDARTSALQQEGEEGRNDSRGGAFDGVRGSAG